MPIVKSPTRASDKPASALESISDVNQAVDPFPRVIRCDSANGGWIEIAFIQEVVYGRSYLHGLNPLLSYKG